MKNPFIHLTCGGRDVERIVTCRAPLVWSEEGFWAFRETTPDDVIDVHSMWCNKCETPEGEFFYEPEEA